MEFEDEIVDFSNTDLDGAGVDVFPSRIKEKIWPPVVKPDDTPHMNIIGTGTYTHGAEIPE